MRQPFRLFGCCFLMTLTLALSGCDDYDPSDETATARLTLGADCPQNGGETPCDLQTAIDGFIDQAAADPEITVAEVLLLPGTYTGNIRIMDTRDALRIVIKGLSQDRTATVLQGVEDSSSVIDVRRVGEIIIENLTVDGLSILEPTETGGPIAGIRIEGTKGRINNVAVNNTHNGDGSAQGIGIQIHGANVVNGDPPHPPVEQQVEIAHTSIRNYSRVGILADGDGGTVDIHDNTLSGQVMSPFHAPNAIQISRGVKGDIRNNRIEGARSPDPLAGAASGILFYCVQGGIAIHNTVTGADLGISLVDSQDTTISSNNVMPLTTVGITVQVLGLSSGCEPESQVSRNNILSNNNLNSSFIGIELISFSPDISVPANNHFAENTIIGQSQGFVGIIVNQAVHNIFADNLISNSAAPNVDDPGAHSPEVIDQTVGAGTGGTANTYLNNQCAGSEPAGLCHDATAATSHPRAQHRTVAPSVARSRDTNTGMFASVYIPDAESNP